MPEITYKIYDKIEQIGRKSWEAAFGDQAEGYLFYKAVEDSRLAGFTFHYLELCQDAHPAVIAPLFCADFNLDIAAEGFLARAIKFVRIFIPRFLIYRTVFCGSPFSESGALGARGPALSGPLLKDALLQAIESHAEKCRAQLIIFKDFLENDAERLDDLKRSGFMKLDSFPAVGVDLNFGSFEEYLQSLGSATRKNLRKKLKTASAQGGIEVRLVEDITHYVDEITRLYENAYQAGSTKFEKLTAEFFLQVNKQLSSQARFFLYYVHGKLAAFNLCLVHKNILIDKFIGFDYAVSNRYNLYFVSWAHNIKWCLEHSLSAYYPGQTDYEPKIRLGGKLIPLYVYLKHRQPVSNFMLRLLALFLKPDNFDQKIRG
jgi:predicted N-acyltransferase